MEEIKKILHEGEKGHSLVLKTDTDEILVFNGRGIKDLMQLLQSQTSLNILKGAILADKVVGKAAAALMILGKIKAVYAENISEPALQLFASSAPEIEVTYYNKVEYIINRTKTGWCPMELACKNAKTPTECLMKIKAKLIELQQNKK